MFALVLVQTSELSDVSAAIKESTLMLGSTALLKEICGWVHLMRVGIASQALISGLLVLLSLEMHLTLAQCRS